MTRWWRKALAALGLLAIVALAGAEAAPEWPSIPQPLELRQGAVTVDSVGGAARSAPLTLPYQWDRENAGQPGLGHFVLPFELQAVPAEPWGLYILRVGNSFEISLNGVLLQANGDLAHGNGDDYSQAPVFVPVPANLLRAGANRLDIRIRADSDRRAGLSPVRIGRAAALRDGPFDRVYTWRHTGSVLLAGFSTVVGLIALAVWLTQVQVDAAGGRRRQRFYMWAVCAELGWALFLADSVITQPPLPWPAWGALLAACYAGWAASASQFLLFAMGWNNRVSLGRRVRGLAALGGPVVLISALAFALGKPQWNTWAQGAVLAIALVFVALMIGASLRQPSRGRLLMTVVAVTVVGAAARDWWVLRWSDDYGAVSWVRYVSMLFGISLLTVVVVRFRAASAQAAELLATLAQRVAQRESELALSWSRLEQAAREQARVHERERILRDMHDGVGAHISAAIRQLQAGEPDREALLRLLRDSLDQLKLSIDAIHLPPGDVGALLAELRYRLAPRLSASALALEWAVDELQPVARLDAQAMRQLQFLLFEVISNVLQHAHAGVLRIEAAMHGNVLRLALVDDGCGFDTAQQMPRALVARAHAIGARLALASRPGRTAVQLELDTA